MAKKYKIDRSNPNFKKDSLKLRIGKLYSTEKELDEYGKETYQRKEFLGRSQEREFGHVDENGDRLLTRAVDAGYSSVTTSDFNPDGSWRTVRKARNGNYNSDKVVDARGGLVRFTESEKGWSRSRNMRVERQRDGSYVTQEAGTDKSGGYFRSEIRTLKGKTVWVDSKSKSRSGSKKIKTLADGSLIREEKGVSKFGGRFEKYDIVKNGKVIPVLDKSTNWFGSRSLKQQEDGSYLEEIKGISKLGGTYSISGEVVRGKARLVKETRNNLFREKTTERQEDGSYTTKRIFRLKSLNRTDEMRRVTPDLDKPLPSPSASQLQVRLPSLVESRFAGSDEWRPQSERSVSPAGSTRNLYDHAENATFVEPDALYENSAPLPHENSAPPPPIQHFIAGRLLSHPVERLEPALRQSTPTAESSAGSAYLETASIASSGKGFLVDIGPAARQPETLKPAVYNPRADAFSARKPGGSAHVARPYSNAQALAALEGQSPSDGASAGNRDEKNGISQSQGSRSEASVESRWSHSTGSARSSIGSSPGAETSATSISAGSQARGSEHLGSESWASARSSVTSYATAESRLSVSPLSSARSSIASSPGAGTSAASISAGSQARGSEHLGNPQQGADSLSQNSPKGIARLQAILASTKGATPRLQAAIDSVTQSNLRRETIDVYLDSSAASSAVASSAGSRSGSPVLRGLDTRSSRESGGR